MIGNSTGVAIVAGPRRTLVIGNTVMHNENAGIVVADAPETTLRRNSLALNGADGFVAIRTAAH